MINVRLIEWQCRLLRSEARLRVCQFLQILQMCVSRGVGGRYGKSEDALILSVH